jgi:3-deoxy-manno-octulosonate cytidylyltransferase (CMP-KDO synthetase)
MPHNKVIVIIPARMASSRLPGKPCADIHGKPMIVRVWEQATAAGIGPVAVACCGTQIREVIEQAGGQAIMTDPDLPRGTDRVYAALRQIERAAPEQSPYEIIINPQGDLPNINPALLQQVLVPFANPAVDIVTLAVPVESSGQRENSSHSVKIAMREPTKNADGVKIGQALYFSRSLIPYGAAIFYHHIGVYAYRRKALESYVQLPESYLEKTEALEQLRALEAGMRIDVVIVNELPFSVDTLEDLENVRQAFLD